jgi:hypothetical protein
VAAWPLRSRRTARAVLYLTILAAPFACLVAFDEVRAIRARKPLLDLRASIAAARNRDEASDLLPRSVSEGLRARIVRPDQWVVETPTQIGARNWVLWIELDGERVRALRVRTEDSINQKPTDAPDDLVLVR